MKFSTRLGLLALTTCLGAVAAAQIFADPAESLAAYNLVKDPDSGAEIINYSNFTRNDALGVPVSWSIPEAPRPVSGGGATTGILLWANKDTTAGTQGVNLILKAGASELNVTSKNYVMSVDCYIKCDAPTGSGTTEAFNIGVSRTAFASPFGWYNRTTAGNGHWLTYVGDGGINGTDMRLYRGTTLGPGLDVSNPICQSVFSAANGYEFIGAPSGAWSRVDMIVSGGRVYTKINGTTLFSTTPTFSTDGGAWFGYDDPFGGVAGAPQKQWAVVDNVTVKELPTFKGIINVTGYAGDITTENFTALVLDSNGVVVDNLTIKVDAAGAFEFGTTVSGAASVVLVGDSTLNRLYSNVTAVTGGFDLGAVNLLNGNINGDAVVDIADYSVLAAKFDASSGDPDWNVVGTDGFRPSQADITGDGIVDIADYTQVAANFDAVSEYVP